MQYSKKCSFNSVKSLTEDQISHVMFVTTLQEIHSSSVQR